LIVPTSGRIDHIDSIRGFAALLVVFHHVTETFVRQLPRVEALGTGLHDVAFELNFGRMGVVVFFIISGFVICPSLKGGRMDGARNFFVSRFFRLYPAFWTIIVLALLLRYMWPGRPIDIEQVLGNLPMLYSVFQVKPLLGLFWTLEVELAFYLLCVLLFLCGGLHRPLVLFFVSLGLVIAFRLMLAQHELMRSIGQELGPHWRLMLWHLALMLWGGLFRMWYDNRDRVVSVGSIKIPIIVLVVVLMMVILIHPVAYTYQWVASGKYQHLRQFIPYFLGIALFVIFALHIKIKAAVFVWLGAVSYSLYLVHPVVFHSLLFTIKRYYPQWGGMHLSVYLLVSVALSLALSGLVYRIVEKPAIRLGRNFRRS